MEKASASWLWPPAAKRAQTRPASQYVYATGSERCAIA
jgi:hypothetical protein